MILKVELKIISELCPTALPYNPRRQQLLIIEISLNDKKNCYIISQIENEMSDYRLYW